MSGRIPGFTSTGSKRPDALFGAAAAADLPRRMTRSSGCRVWDEQGREYLDFVMGLGSVAIGYGDPEVSRAAIDAVEAGIIGPLPPVHEEAAAEALAGAMPWMEQTRFLKSGAEAVSAAVRIARAHTGREHLLVCGYHGWHDWCQPREEGVPARLGELVTNLPFDDPAAATAELRARGDRVAAVVIEPVVERPPSTAWLAALRAETERAGAVLVFDEIKTAGRVALGGAGERWGVRPDLVVVGKAIANGFPLAAVGGRRDVMEAASRTWISSTTATEYVSLGAAAATVRILRERGVPATLRRLGGRLYVGFARLAEQFPGAVTGVIGVDEMCALRFRDEAISGQVAADCARAGVLFKRGAYNFVSAAHDEADVDRLLGLLAEVLAGRR